MARMNGHGFPPLTGKATSDTSGSAAACGTVSSTVSTPGSTVHYLRRARPAPVQFPAPPAGWPDGPADMADQAAEDAAARAANLAIDGLVARAQHINGMAQQAEQDEHDAYLRRTREVYARAAEEAARAEDEAQAVASRCPPCSGDCAQGRECPVTWAARRSAWLAAAEPIERRHPWLWLVYAAVVLGAIALSLRWPMGWALRWAS
jgi:hypothetical protein